MPEKTNHLSGFLVINKPAGVTSHDVVNQIRKISGVRQVGHAGTLDPFATGVLIIGVGNTTRLLEYAKDLPKTYEAEITLGATSDTDDLTGKIVANPGASLYEGGAAPSAGEVQAVLQQFLGPIQQVPPAYAAIKVKGKKLYEYARRGETVERKPRTVTIHSIQLLSYEYPRLTLEVHCSSGTYVRSLGRDIGENLSTGGYVSHLVRKDIHMFHISEAVDLSQLSPDSLTGALKPPEGLIAHFPPITLSSENVVKWRRGIAVEIEGSEQISSLIAVFDEFHSLIGIGHLDPDSSLLHPQKVL